MSSVKSGNPAVVGLAGFGITTFVLQMHNIGLLESMGPVLWLGVFVGGLAQLVAGFQVKATGNNFGYSAFTIYGAFWLAFAGILISNEFGFYTSSHEEIGFFLIPFTIYTGIMLYGALYIHKAEATIFGTLFFGFLFLVIGHFGPPVFNVIAGYVLIACSCAAWYVMAHYIYKDVCGRDVLPVGAPVLGEKASLSPVLQPAE
ncbi:acetate uptake transporter [Pseudovibrio sp. SPO723]|uniref:acetate uptake transporter n=1 Tax=Nesiotobacter zosterae TaxID=392721 RepID=UPI0029C27B31|nr:acetate uptake transporter [Pseudovibrio sp. SPO723]MDX5594783.1 acetate uptake transporter [Pseudovibrio sp. SPO723]